MLHPVALAAWCVAYPTAAGPTRPRPRSRARGRLDRAEGRSRTERVEQHVGDDGRPEAADDHRHDPERGADHTDRGEEHGRAGQAGADEVGKGERDGRADHRHHGPRPLLDRPQREPAKEQLLGEGCPDHDRQQQHIQPRGTVGVPEELRVVGLRLVGEADEVGDDGAGRGRGPYGDDGGTEPDREIDPA